MIGLKQISLKEAIGFGSSVLLVLVVPLIGGEFWQYMIANMLLLAVFALSFNLLFGMAGYLSFGHAAFYAVGAYVTGLLMLANCPLLMTIFLGAAGAAILAAVLGIFCVRNTQAYFSLLTLAMGMMVYAIVWKWASVTGGDDGLIGIPRGELGIPGIISLSLNGFIEYYYFLAIVSFLAIAVLYCIHNSPFGLVLRGIRENFSRVDFSGINARKYVWIAFVIAGFFAGLAGALMAPMERTVSPAIANWTKSGEPVFASLIGGPEFFFGPVVGAVIFLGLKELIVRFTQYWLLCFGILLLGIVLGFRGGVIGFIQKRLAKKQGDGS
jgi:branched-chain amino acid transport system permease protein